MPNCWTAAPCGRAAADACCAAPCPAFLLPEAASSLGTMSIKKSNYMQLLERRKYVIPHFALTMSDFAKAEAMSDLCSVLRLFSSACIQARIVSSVIKMSHPFAKRIGASAEIILTSGSAFMTFLIRARGSWCSLKSCSSVSNRVT